MGSTGTCCIATVSEGVGLTVGLTGIVFCSGT